MKSRRRHVLHGEMLLEGEQAAKRDRRERRVLWRRIGLVLAFAGVVAGVIGLYFSPVLRVDNVEISGNTVVDTQDVLDMADLEGDPIFRVDTDALAERVMALPMVYRAKVERDWPGTIRIEIMERSPWGYWKAAGNVYPIDVEGVVLSGVQPAENATTIEDTAATEPLSAGDQVDADAVFLAQVLLDRLPDTVSPTVGDIEYSGDVGLSVQTSAGYRVIVGDSQNFDYKLAVWKALEEELGPQGMAGHVLDLRFGDRPSLVRGGDES